MKRIVAALLLWLTASLTSAWADAGLQLGVLALRSKEQTLQQWQPLATHLEGRLRVPVQLSVYDLTELEAAVAAKSLDVVFTSPSHFIALKQRYGLSAALATQVTRVQGNDLSVFAGATFTRADRADIRHLGDVVGKRIAISGIDSTGGYQMQALEMLEAGLPLPKPEQLVTAGMPQDLTVEAVMSGRADVGLVRSGVFEAMAQEGKLDLASVKVIDLQSAPAFLTSARPACTRNGLSW